jgi:ribosome-binding protein aMBF1 (putative translation factor)
MIKKDLELAPTVGLKPSMIYKIRKGQRHPSVRSMIEIEKQLNWSLNEQIMARKNGTYKEEFVTAAGYKPELEPNTGIHSESAEPTKI